MSQAMVIDDSRAIRMILAGILKELGYDVTQAVNGKDALDQVASYPAMAVFLVDWNMPEMNGLEFVQAIRQDPRFRATPLMMVTTETEISQMAKALEAGANEYVMKPFTKDMIHEKLQLMGVQ
jgi:two-component system, chemotaxis family, chemotaxis protein CheY